MASHLQEGRTTCLASTEWRRLGVLTASTLLLPDANVTGPRGDGGGEGVVGMQNEQLHSWEWLRGVGSPGDRGMGASHRVTFHVTLGRCLLVNSPLSFKPHPCHLELACIWC